MKLSLRLTPLVLGFAALTPALAAAQHGAEEPSGPLVVNGGLAIWTVVVFLLLLLILRRFAWPVLLSAVQEREQRLERQIEETERNRAESARLLEEHKKLVADARSSAQSIIAEARAAGDRERALAVEKTKAEQAEAIERARREIVAERERAVADLRREAVDLSLAAAGKLVGARLDSETDRKLVSDYLASLEGAH
jgi:F-type H+-transporting ATPase subunit b